MTHPREATNRHRKARAIADVLLKAGHNGGDVTEEQWALAASVAGKGAPSDATKAVVLEMLSDDEKMRRAVRRSADYHQWWDAPDGKPAGVDLDDWREARDAARPKVLQLVQTAFGRHEHLADPDNDDMTLCGKRAREIVAERLPECSVCRTVGSSHEHWLPYNWRHLEAV